MVVSTTRRCSDRRQAATSRAVVRSTSTRAPKIADHSRWPRVGLDTGAVEEVDVMTWSSAALG